MAIIKANGSAVSMWERAGHHSGGSPYRLRVVLWCNGRVLTRLDRVRRLSRGHPSRQGSSRHSLAGCPNNLHRKRPALRLPHQPSCGFRRLAIRRCGDPTTT
jgi:hypothetical protein